MLQDSSRQQASRDDREPWELWEEVWNLVTMWDSNYVGLCHGPQQRVGSAHRERIIVNV